MVSGEAPANNIADNSNMDPTPAICNSHPTKLETIQRRYAVVSMKDKGSDIPGKQDAVPIPLETASNCLCTEASLRGVLPMIQALKSF